MPDFTTAIQEGQPVREYPFAGDDDTFIDTYSYVQRAADFAKLATGTAHADHPALKLIDETKTQPRGRELVAWKRLYATIPGTRYEYETYVFGVQYLSLDGELVELLPMDGGSFSYSTSGSHRFGVGSINKTLLTKVKHEYFLDDDPTTAGGSGATGHVTAIGDGVMTGIALDTGGTDYVAPIVTVKGGLGRDGGRPAKVTATMSGGVVTGLTLVNGGEGYDATPVIVITDIKSIPIFEARRWQAVGTTVFATGGSVVDTLVVAEDSKISRWRGNIFDRATRLLLITPTLYLS